jgi:hypothetical protein
MTDHSFTATFAVDQTPEEAFAAIANVRLWWSENITGRTDKLGATFDYRFKDIHRCTMRITEFVPARRIAWHVVSNYFDFTRDKTEWTGTDITFEITRRDEKTEIRFTHHGLVPEYECYDVCSDGWGTYINGSLRDLITTGKGHPNVGEAITGSERVLTGGAGDYATAFTVDRTPQEVFAAINDVRGWWSGEIDGNTDKVGDEFSYRYEDIHYSKQKITELVPGRRVAWRVLDARLSFATDKAEWRGTDIVFDIVQKGDKTELRFTHIGLVPELECFESCSGGWRLYIDGSLRNFIAASKNEPERTKTR